MVDRPVARCRTDDDGALPRTGRRDREGVSRWRDGLGNDPRRPGRRRGRGRRRDAARALLPAARSHIAVASRLAYPLLALAYRAPVPVIAVGAFLGGAAFAIFDTQWQTTMQREVAC